jgi:PTH1 family peptidyl-tRNA hydrolase
MGEYLIVGLGNPGSKYEKTRHNLGFIVVEAFAKKHGFSFKRGWRLNGKIAVGTVEEEKIYLLLPTTYMNLSGSAVRKAVNFYKLPLSQLLVVVDDVYIKVGAMRIRSSGTPGGHNGLKNIDASLGTQDYPRLRVGIGPEEGGLLNGREMALEDYVLGEFTPSEQTLLPLVAEKSISVIECWLSQGIEAASQLAAGELKDRLK